MAASNLAVLTDSHRIIASKKRARREQVKQVVFDEDARREFLTGFHKRKVQKKEAKKLKAVEREKQERLDSRREKRQILAEKAAENAAQVERAYGGHVPDDEEEEEWDGFGSGSDTNGAGKRKGRADEDFKEEEYEDEEQLATVTVVEDFDPAALLHGPNPTNGTQENDSEDGDVDEVALSQPGRTAVHKEKGKLVELKKAKARSKVATKAKSVKYQTNAARKADRSKQIRRKKEKAERAGGKATRKGKGRR